MASTYSTNLKIELQATGENSGTWGTITNTNLGTALEQAIVGYGNPNYASDANLTLTYTDTNAAQAARALVLNVTSGVSLTGTRELVVPTIQKQYIVQNNTTGSQSITVKTSAGTGITVPNGRKAHLYVDGTNVIYMDDYVDINGGAIDGTTIGANSAAAGTFTTVGATTGNITTVNATTVDATNVEVTNVKAKDGTAAATIADSTGIVSLSANPILSGGTANGVLYLNGSKVATSGSALTFDGNNLGLSVASPDARITIPAPSFSSTATGGTIRFKDVGTSDSVVQSYYVSTEGTDINLASNAYVATSGSWTRFDATKPSAYINVNRGGNIQFAVGSAAPSEQMRLDSSGNLGIGTSSPANKLDVEGAGKFSISTGVGVITNRNVILAASDTAGQLIFQGGSTASATAGLEYARINTTADDATSGSHDGSLNFFTTTNGTSSIKAKLDSSGNLGLGVTPSAWRSSSKAFQIGGAGVVRGESSVASLSCNNYINSSNQDIYINTGFATSYAQSAGQHLWFTAASGTAGNAITFTQAMTLTAGGNLLLGSTTAPTGFSRVSLVGGESSGSGANSGVQFTYNASTYGGGAITTVNAAGGGMSFYTFTGNVGSESYTERARITSDGKFGLNTTNPQALLDIQTATGVNAIAMAAWPILKWDTSNEIAFGGYTANQWQTIKFYTAATERARIDSVGRLLVKTTTPFFNDTPNTIELAGNGSAAALQPTIYVKANTGTEATHTAYLTLARSRGTSDNSTTIVASGDRLGMIRFQGANGTGFTPAAEIYAEVDGTPGASNDMPGRIVFATTKDGEGSATERARITAAGQLLVGQTTNQGQVTAAASGNHGFTANVTTGSAYACFRGRQDASDTARYYLWGSTGGVDKVFIFGNGDIQNANNSYGVISDQKLKKDITDASSQWDDIKNVRIRKYKYINDAEGTVQIGVVAQELEQVSPGLVYESPDFEEIEAIDEDGNTTIERKSVGSTKAVKTSVLYMKAVKALQEAMARIEQLEAKVTALESK